MGIHPGGVMEGKSPIREPSARQSDRRRAAEQHRPRRCRHHPGKAAGPDRAEAQPGPGAPNQNPYRACMISRISCAVADGVLPTFTPTASRASCLAAAVPAEPETMAPAWPMVLPSGAVKPAT